MRTLGSGARRGSVDVLRLRLLAAIGGVTVSVACAGRSQQHVGEDNKGGDGGTSAVGGSGGKGGGGGGTGGMLGFRGCANPSNYAPGLEQCEGSFVHRVEAAECGLSPRVGPAEPGFAGEGGGAGVASEPAVCTSDLDCVDEPNGYCGTVLSPEGYPITRCVYACATDADCAEGAVCSCDTGHYTQVATGHPLLVGVCSASSCGTDSDCGSGSLCVAPISDVCGPHIASGFRCDSPADECRGIGECGGSHECWENHGRYVCVPDAACGRPFLVGGTPRHSDLIVDAAWLERALADAPLAELDFATRSAIAQHFTHAALMEHASIAAFARFALQLLALGAPPELLADTSRAMSDETRHAQVCFGLASRYAERDIGPGPLDVHGALTTVEPFEVVELAVAEGCIGETAAALEAAWAAEDATDPVVRQALSAIAEDEARHAALALRFVAWAAQKDARMLERVERQLRAARAALDAGGAQLGHAADAALTTAHPPNTALLAAHGVLSPELRRAARRAALDEILPALLERAPAAPARAASSAA